jgi:hypothetical protein
MHPGIQVSPSRVMGPCLVLVLFQRLHLWAVARGHWILPSAWFYHIGPGTEFQCKVYGHFSVQPPPPPACHLMDEVFLHCAAQVWERDGRGEFFGVKADSKMDCS